MLIVPPTPKCPRRLQWHQTSMGLHTSSKGLTFKRHKGDYSSSVIFQISFHINDIDNLQNQLNPCAPSNSSNGVVMNMTQTL